MEGLTMSIESAIEYLSWGLHTEPTDAVIQVCSDLFWAMRNGHQVPWHRAPGAARATLAWLMFANPVDGAPAHA